MAFSLKYGGIAPPSFFRITGVDQYILPSIEHYNSKITGAYGGIDGGIAFDNKVFKVHYTIIYDDIHDDTYYIDTLALWLLGDDVKKFQLDNSGEYYKARVTDATDFKDSILYGSGTITFTASNPRRYAPTETTVNLATSGSTSISYDGYVPVCPVFTVVCPTGTTSVKITNTTTEEVVIISDTDLGGTLVIDCNKKFISLDGTKKMMLLTMGSDWITLKRGSNIINVVVGGTAITSINLKYTAIK